MGKWVWATEVCAECQEAMREIAGADQLELKDNASAAAAEKVAAQACRHERLCGCRRRWRLRSWLVVDALVEQGWTLRPPVEADT